MATHDHVADIISIVLQAVATEANVDQDNLSVEVESVVTRGLMEAFKRGILAAYEKPTEPPPRSLTPTAGFPAVRRQTPSDGTPTVRPATPAPFSRPRIPSPMPRRDPRRDPED